jgi:cobalt-zinc-cadmium efflux system protein
MIDRRHDDDHDDHDHEHHHHDHGHAHGHGHSHAPSQFGRAFAIGIALNVAIVVLQAVFGVLANSVALLADAGHNLSDVLSLAVAWGAMLVGARLPSARMTYGLKGASILAALFNAVLLLVIVGGLSWEAVLRLHHLEPVASGTMSAVAAVGMVLNGLCAWLFLGGRNEDLNVKGAFLHMAGDAAISAGVVVAGLAMLATGWLWLDPIVSLVINAVVVWGTWSLLRESAALAVSAVPGSVDPDSVRDHLARLGGVAAVHDLHIWAMSTTDVALTAHLVMPSGHPGDEFLRRACTDLRESYGICHATLQIEQDATGCALASDHVV